MVLLFEYIATLPFCGYLVYLLLFSAYERFIMETHIVKNFVQTTEDFEKIDIPKWDLSGMDSDNIEDLKRLAKDLLTASNEYGIVALENHQVPMEKIKRFFNAGDAFFDLPDEIKMKYEHTMKPYHGYFKECCNMDGEYVLMNECFDIMIMDEKFPSETPQLKETSQVLYDEFRQLHKRLLKLLDVAFDSGDLFQRNLFRKSDGQVNAQLKMLRYPKVHEKLPAGTIRFRSHYDFDIFTLLHTMDGLQIQAPTGEWKHANIPPNSILMQYGFVLERLSSDRLRAPKHRVVITEREKISQIPRRVFVCFQMMNDDEVIQSLDGSGKYSPATYGELIALELQKYHSF